MRAPAAGADEAIAKTLAGFSMLLGLLLSLGIRSRVHADDPVASADAAAVAAIETIGGSVRPIAGKSEDREVEFHLRGRKLTDEGLVHVAALKNVVSLNLRDTKITGAGLAHLKGLTKLRWLHLERTRVGDEGIENLAGLVNLEYLNLYATKITDRSLGRLTGLKKLERLYVWKTGVTDAGVERLEKALPKLRIVRGVDLSKLSDYSSDEPDPPKPTANLKWIAASEAKEAPRSKSGLNTQVFFENKSGRRVNLVWVSYGGKLELYAQLAPGAIRQQNSYSKNTWLITDDNDKPLGYFIVGIEVSRAVIPKQKQPE